MFVYILIVLAITSWSLRKRLALLFSILKCGYRFLRNPGTFLELLSAFHDAYPDIFRVPLTFRRWYFISKPEYFEKVLSSPLAIDKAKGYSLFDDFFGPNIFTATEKLWRKQRRILNLSFNQRSIDSYSGVFFEEAENLAEKLVKHQDARKDKDVQYSLSTCFTQEIFRSLLGVKYELDVETYTRELDRAFSRTARRMISRFYRLTAFKSSITEGFENGLKYGQTIGTNIINKKRKHLAEKKELVQDHEPDFEAAKRPCMLENILEHPEFTEKRALSELLLFIIAGNETSTASLLFTFIALAMQSNIQEKLYEDVVDICGSDGPVTLEHLSRIEYADCVIKESLRIFPVGPMIGRYIQEDLDIGNKVLPKGSTVFLNFIYTHRNSRYWPEPLKFDPDRFLKENASKIYPFSYMPFSHGVRNCIGFRFAMTSMKMALVTTIRKVKIFTDYKSIDEVKLKSHVTLRPRKGWKLRFEARN